MASRQMATPTAAPGPVPPSQSTSVPGRVAVPFNRAAGPTRTQISVATNSKLLTTGQQRIIESIPGSGYMVSLDLEMAAVATGNASTNTVALAEDAPWSAFAAITLDDGGPQMVNIDGYSLYLLNKYGGFGITDPAASADAYVYSALSTGTGTAAGSGLARLRIPAAINDRDYWGILGNQDRATKYNLGNDLAASASIYATAPSTLPTVTISRTYRYLPVPGPTSATGQAQQQMPDSYGIVHYMTSVKASEVPAPGLVNHYLKNLSNAVRLFCLVFRQGSTATPRAAAETAMQTAQIDFKVGSDVIFSESYRERKQIMFNRYGVDGPSGVLVYDFLDDFGPRAGYELGTDYLFLGNVSEAQFAITYPTGYTASASNSLTIVTDSLYIPPEIDIYSLGL